MDAMNLKVKLYLENGNDKFMGIGVLWLLQKVRECRSLREAAQEMGISYSKAFRPEGEVAPRGTGPPSHPSGRGSSSCMTSSRGNARSS